MRTFQCGHAAHPDWREAARSCLDQLKDAPPAANLGFIYMTDLLAEDAQEIVHFFRAHTGIAHWAGTVGIGVCATGREYLDTPAIAVMAGEFGPDSFQIFSGATDLDDLDNVNFTCGNEPAHFAIVHGDSRNLNLAELIDTFAQRLVSGFAVGGLASSRKTTFQVADDLAEGGISGVLMSSAVSISTRLTQGCVPIGAKHLISECQENIIITLDRRPALDVLSEDIGEEMARDLTRIGGVIFVGLPIPGSDTGDYLVRNLVGIDPEHRVVAIGETLEPNTMLMFCRRDRATAVADMKRMLSSIKQDLASAPKGGLYYSCLGRGAGLFGENSTELKLISETLGEFPLVGFFCNGEISHNRLYGYTGVLTLFT
jgi:small ligand-binding sensory domain FIST